MLVQLVAELVGWRLYVVGGLDILRCSLIRKQLEVKTWREEVTSRSLWSSRMIVAWGGRSPGVVAQAGYQLGVGEGGEGQQLRVEDAAGLWGSSLESWFVGGE